MPSSPSFSSLLELSWAHFVASHFRQIPQPKYLYDHRVQSLDYWSRGLSQE